MAPILFLSDSTAGRLSHCPAAGALDGEADHGVLDITETGKHLSLKPEL